MAKSKTVLTLALGTAFAASLATTTAVRAAENPFQMDTLAKGYQVADNDKAKEGKCGGDKAKEGKCGGDKAKEGKCGGDKAKEGGGDKAKEGKCGGDKAKEGSCGGNK